MNISIHNEWPDCKKIRRGFSPTEENSYRSMDIRSGLMPLRLALISRDFIATSPHTVQCNAMKHAIKTSAPDERSSGIRRDAIRQLLQRIQRVQDVVAGDVRPARQLVTQDGQLEALERGEQIFG